MQRLEQVLACAEAGLSVQACANAVRGDAVGLAAAMRWVGRRLLWGRDLLSKAVTMLPVLGGCPPTLAGVQQRLALAAPADSCTAPTPVSPPPPPSAPSPVTPTLPTPELVLVRLRALLAAQLPQLTSPFGFRHRGGARAAQQERLQQQMGADPPPA